MMMMMTLKNKRQRWVRKCFRWCNAGFPVQVLPFAQWKEPTTMTNQITKQSRSIFILLNATVMIAALLRNLIIYIIPFWSKLAFFCIEEKKLQLNSLQCTAVLFSERENLAHLHLNLFIAQWELFIAIKQSSSQFNNINVKCQRRFNVGKRAFLWKMLYFFLKEFENNNFRKPFSSPFPSMSIW